MTYESPLSDEDRHIVRATAAARCDCSVLNKSDTGCITDGAEVHSSCTPLPLR